MILTPGLKVLFFRPAEILDVDAQLGALLIEMAAFQAERTCRFGHVMAGAIQFGADGVSLEGFDARGQRPGSGGCGARGWSNVIWKCFADQRFGDLILRQQEQPFHGVSQLSNVAGPGISFQEFNRRR